MARPTRYKEEFAEQARKVCLLGATDADLATYFEVQESTINNWKLAHPAFMESIKQGKMQADANVADRLYQRAMGYSHPEVDIRVLNGAIVQTQITKQYPPDSTAAIFWLKNRQQKQWRDKIVQEYTDPTGGNPFAALLQAVNGTAMKVVKDE